MSDFRTGDSAKKQVAQMWPQLVAFFNARGGGFDSEDLASDTIVRVLTRIANQSVPADLAAFTYAVARNVRSEYRRYILRRVRRAVEVTEDLPASPPSFDDDGPADRCVIECLRALPARRLAEFVEYYAGPGPNIERRAQMAARLRITPNALQQRVSETRRQLHRAIQRCRASQGRPESRCTAGT